MSEAVENNNTHLDSMIHFAQPAFAVLDYVIFCLFLCLSGAIGIFFSCRSQKTTGEYFFGNRQMRAIPVGISTGVSFLSAPSLVGFPAEMYKNGFGYSISAMSGAIATFIGFYVIANIVHPLKIKSLNDYYTSRFNSSVLTLLANIMVLLCIFHYMGTCMFGAVVAFNSITGGHVSVVLALVIGCSVGVFYTSIGGLKAVVWTDVLQCGFMFLGIFTVLIKSITDTNIHTIFETNSRYGRLDMPSLSSDLTIRHSMWGLTVGASIGWLIWSTQPAIIQRLVSLPNKRDCYIVAGLTCGIYFLFSILPSIVGINIFGYYASRGCDVAAAGWIKGNDILLYYIRDRLNFPGFQGLFVAALYAGSLSSLSSGLSSASSIIWNDLIRPHLKTQPTELRATLICKIIVVVFGTLSMLWSYTLTSFGGLMLQVTWSIDASMYGAYFSLFVFAIFFRYASSKGAIVGIILSFTFTLWLSLSSLIYGKSLITSLPTITDNCAWNGTANSTMSPVPLPSSNGTQPCAEGNSFLTYIYSLSYLWFATICLLTFLLISLIVTACTKSDKTVDSSLLISCYRRSCFRASSNNRSMQLVSTRGE